MPQYEIKDNTTCYLFKYNTLNKFASFNGFKTWIIKQIPYLLLTRKYFSPSVEQKTKNLPQSNCRL